LMRYNIPTHRHAFGVDPELGSLVHYSVVSLMDVLEHTPFPVATLQEVKKFICENGVFIVSCPNSDTAIWQDMGDANPYWNEIEHYHNFTRKSLTNLLEEQGFRVLHYRVSERYISGMELYCV
jgi:hypothetical protein